MPVNNQIQELVTNSCSRAWNQNQEAYSLRTSLIANKEAARLECLQQYQILDTEPEEAFDSLTRLAAHICGTPIALVTISDGHRQWFKSKVGLAVTEAPRKIAFCDRTIMQSGLLIIPDTLADEQFVNNPLVTCEPYIRFYAGLPLIAPSGYALGTICVLDRVPRKLELHQIEALEALQQSAIAQLELRRNLAEVKRTNEALQESEERFRLLVEGVKDYAIFRLDTQGHIVSWNPGAQQIKGYQSTEIIGKHISCFYPQQAIAQGKPEQALNIARNSGRYEDEGWRLRKDGSRFWADVVITPLYDRTGALRGFSKITRDITERKSAEMTRLRVQIMEAAKVELEKEISDRQRAEERLAKLNACFLSFTSDPNENINHLTTLCGELLGANCTLYNRLEAGLIRTVSHWNIPADYQLVDTPEGHICYDIIKGDASKLYVLNDLQNSHYAKINPNISRYQLQTYLGHPVKCDGKNIAALCAIFQKDYIPSDEDQKIISLIAAAIGVEEERKRAESQLVHHAFHDALTGLPNRALLINRLEHTLARAKRRQNGAFAVLFLDLDRFKVVNDSLGHLVGDRLLVEFAQRIQKCLRVGDTVARLGGDEFAILLEDLQCITDATHIAECIQHALQPSFNLGGHEVFTTTSIGIALSTTAYQKPDELLRDADTAMYRAKLLGKARYVVFNQTMHAIAVERLQLENDLRRALERQEFELHYQPIISLQTGFLTGFEALIRWQHPTRGLVSPVGFIPAAEETGLIIPISYWVLREACDQMNKWQKQFPATKPLTISVNLSAKQFIQIDLVKQVSQILHETQLTASSLKLEITESAIMENTQSATSVLLQLKALGIELCMDDFGTGYSSLSYLRRFPIDTLKIDRSFVSHMEIGNENLEIVQTIITLAHNLNMAVVAEGVETAAQLFKLKAMICEFGQGYFFARPLDATAAWALIANYYLDCLI